MIERIKPGLAWLPWGFRGLLARGLTVSLLAKGTLTVALILLVAFGAPPWVLLDPIDRFTHLDGRARSMIPGVFAAGESRASAQAKLSASGYHPIDRADNREINGCRDLACERAAEDYTDFYRKVAVTWSIACSNDFIVWLKFGEDDRLVSARNTVHSICL